MKHSILMKQILAMLLAAVCLLTLGACKEEKGNGVDPEPYSFVIDGVTVTPLEWGVLAVGCVTAFLVSMAAIRFLMDFVKKHSFSAFGWYRIALGGLVLGYFMILGR